MAGLHEFRKKFAAFGPGLMYAGAAVGVSHLVQSTRAGASYGFDLLAIVVLANVIKYPFFEIAPRYVKATGNNLLHGYHVLGMPVLVLFALLTLFTMLPILAAVSLVTSGIIASVFNISWNLNYVNTLLLLLIMMLIWLGHYRTLDKFIKYIVILLTVCTIIAVVYSGLSFNYPANSPHFSWLEQADILFLIALIGWMPAPIDVSVWNSLWTQTKLRDAKGSLEKHLALTDFRIGYWGTTFLAGCFVLLGAFVLYGRNETLSPEGATFASQLIQMYTSNLGKWTYPVVALAALATMLSTTITVMDAYPRILRPVTEMLTPVRKLKTDQNITYRFWLVILVAGTIVLVNYMSQTMRFMVDMATTLSFITAPVLAFLNYRVITHAHVSEEYRFGLWMKIFALTGIVFLTVFSVVFILWRYNLLNY